MWRRLALRWHGVLQPGRVSLQNAVSRFKVLLGVTLASRTLECQRVEALLKTQVLNRLTALGIPKSGRT